MVAFGIGSCAGFHDWLHVTDHRAHYAMAFTMNGWRLEFRMRTTGSTMGQMDCFLTRKDKDTWFWFWCFQNISTRKATGTHQNLTRRPFAASKMLHRLLPRTTCQCHQARMSGRSLNASMWRKTPLPRSRIARTRPDLIYISLVV